MSETSTDTQREQLREFVSMARFHVRMFLGLGRLLGKTLQRFQQALPTDEYQQILRGGMRPVA